MSEGTQRRLAAIVSADVVGYARLMGVDETGTLDALRSHRAELIDVKIAEHGGRIVKTMGDGLLLEFPSVVDAAQCTIEIQSGMAERNRGIDEDRRITFRIGVNLGDIIIEGEDILGDGVNIAARLQEVAQPGGLAISGRVHDDVRDRLKACFADSGERSLKNIARPVRVWQWSPFASSSEVSTTADAPLPLPDKPSLAVLPFDNMSDDAEQEYFADGMVEEIITALSHMQWLFVIARNSSFTYKGRAVDVKQVGRQLGVRYVLEGSVRKAGNRVRISGQLIDASTGAHLWADRFDGALEDVFDLQDQVTASVVGAIAPRLEQAEIERAKRKPSESLDAYDYYLRGLAAVHQWKKEANEEALSLFSRAIELDPNFASAYGMAARCYSMRKASGWMADPLEEVARTKVLARRAAELGKNNAIALCTAGIGLAFVAGELDDGDELIEQALALDPNLAWAWLFSGWVRIYLGEPQTAIERVERAMRLSPHEPHVFGMQSAIALAHLLLGHYAEALSWAQKALRTPTHHLLAACVATASAGLMGETDQADKSLTQLRYRDPHLRVSGIKFLFPIQRPEDLATFEEGLRRAGLPD